MDVCVYRFSEIRRNGAGSLFPRLRFRTDAKDFCLSLAYSVVDLKPTARHLIKGSVFLASGKNRWVHFVRVGINKLMLY